MKFSFVVSVQRTSFQGVALQEGLEEKMELLAEAGYDGVELAVRNPFLLDADGLERALKRLGLGVSAIGTGQAFVDEGLSLTHPEEAAREEALRRVLRHLELASRWRSTLIVGLIRGRIGDRPRAEFESLFRSSMERLLERAEELEVPVALEPLNRYECDFVNTVEEALSWAREFRSRQLGILADTFHMNIEERDMWEAMERAHLEGKLFHVHVADSNRWAPGHGHLDWRGFAETLRRMGYGGWVSGEMQPRPSAEEAIRGTIALLKGLLRGF